MKPLYIFDLDGTLALTDHRRGLLPDWPAFYRACTGDTPNAPVVRTLKELRRAGAEIWIWSGRSDEVEAQTVLWLGVNVGLRLQLRMRPEGDFTPDEKLKEVWLNEMSPQDRKRLVAVFDD